MEVSWVYVNRKIRSLNLNNQIFKKYIFIFTYLTSLIALICRSLSMNISATQQKTHSAGYWILLYLNINKCPYVIFTSHLRPRIYLLYVCQTRARMKRHLQWF